MATKCKYYHYHYRGWGMRSLCFFYKILWLIGPCQPATKHYKHYKLHPGSHYSSPSVKKYCQSANGWKFDFTVNLYFVCKRSHARWSELENRINCWIIEFPTWHLDWIPSEFILCLDLSSILPILKNTFIFDSYNIFPNGLPIKIFFEYVDCLLACQRFRFGENARKKKEASQLIKSSRSLI